MINRTAEARNSRLMDGSNRIQRPRKTNIGKVKVPAAERIDFASGAASRRLIQPAQVRVGSGSPPVML